MLDILKALKQSRNPTVLYGTRRFTAVFNEMTSVHTVTPFAFRSVLLLWAYMLRPVSLPSGLFPSCLLIKTLHAFLITKMNGSLSRFSEIISDLLPIQGSVRKPTICCECFKMQTFRWSWYNSVTWPTNVLPFPNSVSVSTLSGSSLQCWRCSSVQSYYCSATNMSRK
jgi:hypothetical protein